MHVASPEDIKHEIEDGRGEWRYVPPCVRQALALVLPTTPKRCSRSRSVTSGCCAPRMLLPLRGSGPKTDVMEAVETAQLAEQPLAVAGRELLSSSKVLAKHLPKQRRIPPGKPVVRVCSSCGGPLQETGAPGKRCEERPRSGRKGRSASCVLDTHSMGERTQLPGDTSSSVPGVTRRTSSGEQTSRRTHNTAGVVQPINMEASKIKRVECIRHRREVTDALLHMVEAVKMLSKEVDTTVVKSVADAMRLDPRRAKDVRGEVTPVASPSEEQQEALKGLSNSVRWLTNATNELVAVFLTPEEKRFLGLNTHRLQTRKERSTTYQYAKTYRRRDGGLPPPPPGVGENITGDLKEGPRENQDGEGDADEEDVSGKGKSRGEGVQRSEGGKSAEVSSKGAAGQTECGAGVRSPSGAAAGAEDHNPEVGMKGGCVEMSNNTQRSSQLSSVQASRREEKLSEDNQVKKRLSVSTRGTAEEVSASNAQGSPGQAKLSVGRASASDVANPSVSSTGAMNSLPKRRKASDSQSRARESMESLTGQEPPGSAVSGASLAQAETTASAGDLANKNLNKFAVASDSDSDSD